MNRIRALVPAIVCLALAACAPAALGAPAFHPRVKNALGLVPKIGSIDMASGLQTPVTYHGGAVMSGGVTVHTIFWAPPGYQFTGSPGPGIPAYEDLVQQFFTDTAHDSGAARHLHSTTGPATSSRRCPSSLRGRASSNLARAPIPSTTPPARTRSTTPIRIRPPNNARRPNGIGTCLTDAQVQAEVDRLIEPVHGTRGLHDLWYVFLPPNVDECISRASAAPTPSAAITRFRTSATA